jgi:succinate dehydrogenase/fumarate reductase flavoprotein subunit
MTENTRPEDLNRENSLNTSKKGESTMSSDEKEQKRMSRREFVRGAAVGAAGVAAAGVLASCAQEATPCPTPEVIKETVEVPVEVIKEVEAKPWLPEKWDYEADVVIVGYGGAGATAAITAHDAGAKVLILEKVPIEGGGSTRMSAGSVHWVRNVSDGATYMHACSGGATPMDVCQAWAEEQFKMPDWFAKMKVPVGSLSDTPTAEYKNLPGSSCIYSGRVEGRGEGLFSALDKQVKDRGIEVLFDTPAQELIQDGATKEILGVIANSKGQKIAIKAKKAVALTCGGFMYNEEMKLNFLRVYPFRSYSWKFNTGDGIRMAQKVGAALWHTNFVIGRGTAWFPDLEPGVAGFIGGTPKKPNYILVDKYGRRYCDEKIPSHSQILKLSDYDGRVPEYTRIPIYVIFDETARLAGGLCSNYGGCALPKELGGGYPAWSEDNSAEIAKGWIKKGDTIEALAKALGEPSLASQRLQIVLKLDPAILKASVDKYNIACANKQDEDFGRDPATLAPIQTPPFYGMPLWPGCSDNPGGPKRNAKAQVVDPYDKPIPRLYEAGALGCIIGLLYPRGGGFLMDGLTFGQIAGRNMAAEKSWA